jgi:hypothetical protein
VFAKCACCACVLFAAFSLLSHGKKRQLADICTHDKTGVVGLKERGLLILSGSIVQVLMLFGCSVRFGGCCIDCAAACVRVVVLEDSSQIQHRHARLEALVQPSLNLQSILLET